MNLKRTSGILLHIASLPGKYGVGSFGKEAYEFVDFLNKSGVGTWQILPVGPTGYGNSPYQCYSSVAGNSLFIDLDELVHQGWIPKKMLSSGNFEFSENKVLYDSAMKFKTDVIAEAFKNFMLSATETEQYDFETFCDDNARWLENYALFMSLKKHFNGEAWFCWDTDIKMRKREALMRYGNELEDEINLQKFIQFLFFKQWKDLKDYANAKGVLIIGDVPLYIAYDSADAWAHPELFLFDKEKTPLMVAGVPPDYFSETGQLWGNPLYNWSFMEKDDFKWWVERIRHNLQLFDIIRIDHFRGLESFWAVPFGEDTAVNGQWVEAPGRALFKKLKESLGDLPLIAEDLGVITPEVEALRDDFNFPGMRILQFAFGSGSSNDYLPHNFSQNCVVYTGTHDNDTTKGWLATASAKEKAHVKSYLGTDDKNILNAIIRSTLSSVAKLAIVPMQDYLSLGAEARMNVPGKPADNWTWRLPEGYSSKKLISEIRKNLDLYSRYLNQ